jgi:arabinofuranosyltransferase
MRAGLWLGIFFCCLCAGLSALKHRAGGRFRGFSEILVFAIFGAVLMRTAWVCDDAYFTIRSIDNFLHGYGMRFNVDERVQAYTHPLWMILLTAFISLTREVCFTPMIVSLFISTGALLVVWRFVASSSAAFVVGGITLLLSSSFIDFSSSGLENPLTHLLLAAFYALILAAAAEKEDSKIKYFQYLAALTGGLVVVNRMDLSLLLGPALLVLFATARGRAKIGVAVAACTPLLLWVLFSIIYYGYPFPNTAYAKLGTGEDSRNLFFQGFFYAKASFQHDPVGILVALVGIGVGLASKRTANVSLVLGMILYALYTIKVGGCFMVGRFFTPVIFSAVLILSSEWGKIGLLGRVSWILAILTGALLSPLLPPNSGKGFASDGAKRYGAGIIDERSHYYSYKKTGFLHAAFDSGEFSTLFQERHERIKNVVEIETGTPPEQRIVPTWGLGMRGLASGPRVFIIDEVGLADPLLSRISAVKSEGAKKEGLRFRIGHARRKPPEGYYEAVVSGENKITDPQLRDFYNDVRLVTRGDLFTAARWSAIIRVNRDWPAKRDARMKKLGWSVSKIVRISH